jgi:hypothetical protein
MLSSVVLNSTSHEGLGEKKAGNPKYFRSTTCNPFIEKNGSII